MLLKAYDIIYLFGIKYLHNVKGKDTVTFYGVKKGYNYRELIMLYKEYYIQTMC